MQDSDAAPPALVRRCTAAVPSLPYYLVEPREKAPDAPLLVAVHGISRNAEAVAQKFGAATAMRGVVLAAPEFSRERFPGYQRFGAGGQVSRADQALQTMVAEIRAGTPYVGRRLWLFGHSGGAQFVHRFVMAWPEKVERYVVSAAGWYTWPSLEQPFPIGIGWSARLPDARPIASRFLRVRGRVMVGDRDTRRGPTLNTAPEIDRAQGDNRVSRGRRFVEATNALARQLELPPPLSFQLLPNAGHLFSGMASRGGVVSAALDFLSPDQGA